MIAEYPPELLAEVKEKTIGCRLTGFTPGQGLLEPDLMLVGEAPGRHEEQVNIPFSGASGQELMGFIESIGYSRSTVYITSVVRQRPYSIKKVRDKKTGEIIEKYPNRTPTKKEVLAFAPLFDWELATVKPSVIVPLGNTALQRLLGRKANIGELHGQLLHEPIQHANHDHDGYQMTREKYWLMPMYHPAAVLYARRLEPTIKADWQRLGQQIKRFK
ncbi:uracil-DNA glycosylase [Limosilactobacillus sp. STM2_1]|uniref:Uracil-DNA glycosylase n=1 Tax=Limosilactobacillus rudii TaxID=2759755 RepID=A0A7W3UMA3_9LACO|nr:uracil-DNA glycosylase [Limosilactobacillus rudii]MBB1078769.1 uracil-DNA glycosylase [Limosilactobacillus rudii]MBB1098201.1 uracil-DNA glycosylase [Limosilactobacillus rudii]MCD7135273.1 uracil-DNA glycosylase [Limosilactobacillus rudii]